MTSTKIPSTPLGEIITFYSYKGGSGRTMALSNIGCILRKQSLEKGDILMIDWDLEAPGLHRYFRNQISSTRTEDANYFPVESDDNPGLIDLFIELSNVIKESGLTDAHSRARYALDRVRLEDFIISTDINNLFMLKAGRFDEKYSERVNTFNWQTLYYQSPLLFRLFAEKLAERYRYVLVDSRTGYTDVSGICTMLMPQKLVVVFTPNRQSYTGLRELIKRAAEYRRQSDDLRPLLVYPLPSRIEFSRDDLRKIWRSGNVKQDITGYQPLFENIFKEVYDLDRCDLDKYFDKIQIQQSANYAYGEEIAVLSEKIHDKFSLSEGYDDFARWLVSSVAPWENEGYDVDQSSKSASELSNRAMDYTNSGNVSLEMGRLDEALAYYRKALEIDEEVNNKARMGADYSNIGNVLQEMGRLDKAYEYHLKALEIDIESKAKARMGADYTNMGNVLQRWGRLDEALEYHQKALEIDYEEVNRKEMAKDFTNIGNVLQEMGKLDEALVYYRKALEIDIESKAKARMGADYSNIGKVLQEMGRLDEAQEHLQKALEIDKDLKERIYIAYSPQDIESALRLYDDLKKAGLNPWLDKKDLLPGQSWRIQSQKVIQDSRYFIPLFSFISVGSRGYVQQEFKYAIDLLHKLPQGKIFVLPARLNDCEIPFEELREIQSVDLFPNWNEGLQILLRVFNI